MSLAVRIYTKHEAQRITEDIKSAGVSARRGLDRLASLLDEARAGNVYQILGFASWTAYLSDVLGGEPMRLPREQRQELVEYLSGEGLSVRAIAPIVGVAHKTVARDLEAAAPVSNDTPRASEPESYWSPDTGFVGAHPLTGEILDVPVTTETTDTHKTRVTLGLDGKQYPQKQREPKPVPTGDVVAQQNAEQGAHAFASSLVTLWGLTFEGHRNRINREWWPAGADAVSPSDRERVTPDTFLAVAAALTQLATEWEN